LKLTARPRRPKKYIIPKPRPVAKPMARPVVQKRIPTPMPLRSLQRQLTRSAKDAQRRSNRPAKETKRIAVSTPRINKAHKGNLNSTRVQRLHKRLSRYKDQVLKLKDCGLGRFLVILACGPSIEYAKIEEFKGHPKIDVMTINKPNRRLWPTKYWAFCDQSQYKRNMEDFNRYNGLLINASSVKVEKNHGQVLIRNIRGKGFSLNLLEGFYIGRSTTYANMQTALWMNYEKIFIFGMDMARVNGKLHIYGVNPDVREDIREKRFADEANNYEYAAGYLTKAQRKRYYFCSRHNPWPFIEKFNKMDETTAVGEIREMAEKLGQT
jgi:hypothetical protein